MESFFNPKVNASLIPNLAKRQNVGSNSKLTTMKLLTFFIMSFLFLSCSKKTGAKQTSSKLAEPIIISFLNGSEDIDGCGEYIIDVNDTIGSQKYLFLSNLSEFGIVNLDDKKQKLYKDTIESKLINDKEYLSVYKNAEYKVKLNLSLEKSYDEGGIYQGKMTVIKGEKQIEKKVHGACGC